MVQHEFGISVTLTSFTPFITLDMVRGKFWWSRICHTRETAVLEHELRIGLTLAIQAPVDAFLIVVSGSTLACQSTVMIHVVRISATFVLKGPFVAFRVVVGICFILHFLALASTMGRHVLDIALAFASFSPDSVSLK